jgi:hypothetical protein
MGLGVGEFVGLAWRASPLEPAQVRVEHSNYGTLGSHSLWRNRRTDTIVSPPDPRMRLWNALLPIVWRFRVMDAAKLSAVASRAPGVVGQPVTFAPPRTASLSGQLTPPITTGGPTR